MNKITIVLIILFSFINIFSQGNNEQLNYSESLSYKPREFKDKKNNPVDAYGRQIKDKKAKSSDSQINNNVLTTTLTKEYFLPVFVTDKEGKAVLDLKKEDFTLFVNGEEQKIEKIENKEIANNLILLLDVSNSTQGDTLTRLKRFASQIVEKLSPQSQIKIIAFDDRAKVYTEFTNDKSKLLKTIENINMEGGTAFYDTISYVLEKEIVPQTKILIFTDGVDTTSAKYGYESSLLIAEKSEAIIFPFRFDTFNQAMNPNISMKNIPPNSILGSILSSNTVIRSSRNTASIKQDYERGKNYLLDLMAITGGKGVTMKNDAQLTDEELNYILNLINPQYFLGFNLSLEPKLANERKQIKLRINRPKLLIETRGSLSFSH